MRLQKPAGLKPGDKIGVVAPAGAVDEERLRAGVEAIERAGFVAELADGALARKGYLAGEPVKRAKALQDFFTRADIAAIFCARGGFGSVQLLPLLDIEAIRRHPKIFVGYSDLSIVLNWLRQRCGMVVFHGPMTAMELARGLEGRSADFFWGHAHGADAPLADRAGRGDTARVRRSRDGRRMPVDGRHDSRNAVRDSDRRQNPLP